MILAQGAGVKGVPCVVVPVLEDAASYAKEAARWMHAPTILMAMVLSLVSIAARGMDAWNAGGPVSHRDGRRRGLARGLCDGGTERVELNATFPIHAAI